MSTPRYSTRNSGRAALRVCAAGVAGLALWHFADVGHVYGWGVAHGVATICRLTGWSARVTASGAMKVDPGIHLVLSRTDTHQGFITGTVPLTWSHLERVSAGTVVFLALCLAARVGTITLPRFGGGLVALWAMQCVAVWMIVGGSLPRGAPALAHAGGLLETGLALVLPPLAWAWVAFGGGGARRARKA
jgi:hypothetical protein